MLIFLAAPARAGIVAANFGAGADGLGLGDSLTCFADHVAGLGSRCAAGACTRRAAAESGSRGVLGALGHVTDKILERHQTRRAAEDVVANLRLDVDH